MARSDFGTYQREKKKKLQEKQNEKKATMSKFMKATTLATNKKNKLAATALQTQAKHKKEQSEQQNPDRFTSIWTDD